jgi:hypothetical protein
MKNSIYWDIMPIWSVENQQMFWRNISLLTTCFLSGFLIDLAFDPEDEGDIFLQNVG